MSTQNEKTALMQKKKVELIDIILRKDDVERNLRKDLNNVQLDFDKSKKMIENYEKESKVHKKEIDELRNEIEGYHETIDNLTTQCSTEHHCFVVARNCAVIFTLVALAAIVIACI